MERFSEKLTACRDQLLQGKEEVRTVFSGLYAELKRKEEELLEELESRIRNLELEFEHHKSTLGKLFKAKEDTHFFLKDNEFSDVLPNTLHKLQSKLDKLEQQITQNARIELVWNTVGFQTSLQAICTILMFGTYNHKMVPKWGAVSKGRAEGDLSMPHGFVVDENSGTILVADTELRCVKVFSREGEHIRSFSEPSREYWDVVIWLDSAYVSHSSGIVKFDSRTGLECGELETGQEMRGLAVCDDGLFACVRRECKIILCDPHLNLLNEIQLKTPFMTEHTLTMAVRLRNYSMYVLFLYSEYSVQIFDMCGLFQRVLVSAKQAPFPRFFSLDSIGNVLLTDNNLYEVRVFNDSGDLVHAIGKMGWSPGQFLKISGIVVTGRNEIFVCDEGTPDRMLQCF